MPDTIETSAVVAMLRGAACKIREHHETLTALDSVTGDGDHGTTMLRAVDAIEQTIDAHPDADAKDVLAKSAWAVMSAAGGSTGPLLGAFLNGLSTSLAPGDDGRLDGAAVSTMLCGGVAAMHKHSRAQVGDKTMMDALLPAAEALEQYRESKPPAELVALAAEAAASGAEQTRAMQAKFGRARNLGERVVGHADPGATSMAFCFAGFAAAVACHTNSPSSQAAS